jgi:hypothetical protein
MDLDPRYVDVAIRRWQALTGRDAIHADSGLTFGEIAEQRTEAAVPQASTNAGGKRHVAE